MNGCSLYLKEYPALEAKSSFNIRRLDSFHNALVSNTTDPETAISEHCTLTEVGVSMLVENVFGLRRTPLFQ